MHGCSSSRLSSRAPDNLQTLVQVMRRGFSVDGRLIRPAMVKVSLAAGLSLLLSAVQSCTYAAVSQTLTGYQHASC